MISWLLLGPRMRSQTAKLKSVTIPDYFDYRYKSSFSKVIRIFPPVSSYLPPYGIWRRLPRVRPSDIHAWYTLRLGRLSDHFYFYHDPLFSYGRHVQRSMDGCHAGYYHVLCCHSHGYDSGHVRRWLGTSHGRHRPYNTPDGKGTTHGRQPHDFLHAGVFCLHHQYRLCRRDETDCRTSLFNPVLFP